MSDSVVDQNPFTQITANGVTTVFGYTFQLLEASDLVVYGNGVVIPSSNYTLSGVGVQAGGSVTFSVAPLNGVVILLSREIALVRATEYQTLGDFKATVVNPDFNRLWMVAQGQRAAIGGVLRMPYPEQTVELPDAATRANTVVAFDSLGAPTVMVPVSGSAADVLTQLANPASATFGANLSGYRFSNAYTTDTVGGKLKRQIYDLDDFPGATDHAKLTAAAAECNNTGRALRIPSRAVNIDSSLGSITLEEITIIGEQVLDGANATIDAGSVFRITGTANSPFKIRRGVVIDGVGFYYPSQTDNAVPTVYAVTLAFDFTAGAVQFVWVKNCVVFNAYRFCDINDASGNVGHIWFEDNTICALNRGIYIRHNLEHIRVAGNNFTFGHWLAATEGGSRGYVRSNCTYLQVDQSDGIETIDNLMFGSLNGVLASASGLCQFMHVALNKFDQVRYGVKATGSGNFDGTIELNTFNSINTQNTALEGRSIEISTTTAGRETITIGPNNFKQATADHIYVSGNNPTRNIVVAPGNYLSWAAFKAAGTYGALNINGNNTSLTLTGGYFMGGNSAAFSNGVMGSFNTLTCNGATFESCLTPLSVTVNTATGSGNVSYVTGATLSDVVSASSYVWGPNNFDKPNFRTPMLTTLAKMGNFANDAAAAAGNVPVGGWYRNGSAVQIRAV